MSRHDGSSKNAGGAFRRRIGSVALGAAALLCAGNALAATTATTLSGRLWIVAAGTRAQFPVPTATPDATFTSDHAVFVGQGPNTSNTSIKLNFTIGSFLNSVAPVTRLRFSGLDNPIVHAAVSSKTPISDGVYFGSGGTFETFIELRGDVRLRNDQWIVLAHKDGVSLAIDGTLVSGLVSSDGAFMQNSLFSGGGGKHHIDLLYVAHVGPTELLFGPVP